MLYCLFVYACYGIQIDSLPITGIPPSPRYDSSMVYSPSTLSLVLFGGYNDLTYFNEIWLFNISSSSWSSYFPLSLSVPGNSYEDPRSNSGFFLHPTDSNLIYMYGGISAYGPLSDLWTYNTATHTWSYLLTFDSFYPLKYNSYTAFRYNAVDYFCIYGGKNILGYTNQIYL